MMAYVASFNGQIQGADCDQWTFLEHLPYGNYERPALTEEQLWAKIDSKA